MKIWRIGSDWGGNSLKEIFHRYSIAFASDEFQARVSEVCLDDLVAITDGQSIIAIGMVSNRTRLRDIGIDPKYHFEGGPFSDDSFSAIRLAPIHWLVNDSLVYDGRGKKFHQAQGDYVTLIRDRFWIEEGRKLMSDIANLLASNRQIILTGAPGTGKTYLAKQIASDTTNGENAMEVRSAFVQFHPSFDYSDFVEGIKPDANEGGQISFKLKNGVFKWFCRRAGLIERLQAARRGWQDRAEFLRDDKEGLTFWETWANGRDFHEWPSVGDLPTFYFIIDEINRADLSRVFGELFYALEPDYRGPKGEVKTQYSAMNTPETFFVKAGDDRFFVPSNVYIIGTMNDLDRSVESMDFALRRRFAWREVEANECLFEQMTADLAGGPTIPGDLFDKAKRRYINLNEAIVADNVLTKAHKIGPAYFRKLVDYAGQERDAFEQLWTNHLHTLLAEYLRGRNDAGPVMRKLKAAYGNES